MKSRIAICVLLLFSVILYGQNRKSYDRLKEKAEKKFEKFEDRKFGKYDRFKAPRPTKDMPSSWPRRGANTIRFLRWKDR